jgi:hypothetical protein
MCPIDVITKPRKRGGLAHLGLWPHEEKKIDKCNIYISCKQRGLEATNNSFGNLVKYKTKNLYLLSIVWNLTISRQFGSKASGLQIFFLLKHNIIHYFEGPIRSTLWWISKFFFSFWQSENAWTCKLKREATYNVTLRCVLATIVEVERQ